MRPSGRAPDQMRVLAFEPAFTKHAEGACLVSFGDTRVLVDPFLTGNPKAAASADVAAVGAGSPRTSAATHSVTARTAVRQRPSKCVRAESAGASSNSLSGRFAYATPSGGQYMTEPFPAEISGPRRSQISHAAVAASSPRAARRSTNLVNVATSGGSFLNHST